MIGKNRNFILVYALVSLTAIISAVGEPSLLHYISRTTIVPLILYAIITTYKKFEHPLIPILITATVFKYLGDIFFMVNFEKVLFRMLGICSFVVANLAYGLMFYLSIQQKEKVKKDTYFLPESFFVLVITLTLVVIFPYIEIFRTPVVIYSAFLALSILAAFRRRKYLKASSFAPVLVGTVFFLLVDILHSLAVFYQDDFREVILVGALSLGHYFVVEGMNLQFKDEIEEESSIAVDPLYGSK